MKPFRIIFICFGISIMTVQLSAMRYSVFQYFLTPLTFNDECFDVLVKNKQYQHLREFYYSLPFEIKDQKDIDALEWLKKKALVDPALAYMAARVLKERHFPTVTWKLYVQLFLLYINLSVARDTSSFDDMLIKNHASMLRQHVGSVGMLEVTHEELVIICPQIYAWRETIQSWSDLPDPSWLLCFNVSYVWAYESITYSPHYAHYSDCFYQLNNEKSNKDFIDAVCQKAYEQWIKRYEAIKSEV